MLVEIPLHGGYSKSNPLQGNPADLLNMYDALLSNGKHKLYQTPGLNLSTGIKFAASGGVRRTYVSRLTNKMHVVVGSTIKQVDSALNVTSGTTIGTDTGYVGIDDTDNEIIFVDANAGYLYDKTTNVYTEITAPGFPTLPVDAVAFGSRFYVIKGESDEIYFSDINDGTAWNTLDKFRITTYPDIAVGLFVLDGRLYVFGRRVTETWILQGGSFPIARDENLVIEYGCVAPGSIATKNGILVWIGYDKEGVTSIVASEGGKPIKVSTPELEEELHTYETPEDARGFMYIENGYLFYQLNFTTANKSWLYNFTSKTWSRLAYKDDDRHRAECYVFFNGKKFVGDYALPQLYEFSKKFHSDDGTAIKRKLITNIFSPNKSKPFSIPYLRFLVEQGTGTEIGNDQEPRILLRISRDNGVTFGNQLHEDIGVLGSSDFHTEFYKLGYFEYGTIVLEVEFYYMIDFAILNCFAEVVA